MISLPLPIRQLLKRSIAPAYRPICCWMKGDLSKSDATLTFTFTTPDYMEKETADKLKPFIRRPLSYVWQGNRYSPAY